MLELQLGLGSGWIRSWMQLEAAAKISPPVESRRESTKGRSESTQDSQRDTGAGLGWPQGVPSMFKPKCRRWTARTENGPLKGLSLGSSGSRQAVGPLLGVTLETLVLGRSAVGWFTSVKAAGQTRWLGAWGVTGLGEVNSNVSPQKGAGSIGPGLGVTLGVRGSP